jgi:serine/threonine protein kinase
MHTTVQSGRPPFNAKRHGKNAMFRAIRAGDFVFYDDDWSHISMSAKKLILGLLQVDPRSRLTPREALNSEWMLTKDDVLRRKSLERGRAEISSFRARRKLKGAISAVMYAVGYKSWNIETAAVWREEMRTDGAVIADPNDFAAGDDDAVAAAAAATPTFDGLYILDRRLQEGHFATVWEGSSIGTGRAHAIKVIKREGLTQLEDAAVMNEVSILRSLRHKNIVPLLDFFETPDRFCLVMEKCNGGDVLERVANIEHYTEKDACQFAKGFLEVREIFPMCPDIISRHLCQNPPHRYYYLSHPTFAICSSSQGRSIHAFAWHRTQRLEGESADRHL